MGQSGVYRYGLGDMLLGATRRVLDGAVTPLPGSEAPNTTTFGWASKGLPVPATGGLYAVEFLSKNEVRVLAYVDLYGRAFTTDVPLTVPPAREPDLAFAKYDVQPVAGEEAGCVRVRTTDGGKTEVAQYRCVRDRYTLFDSWFDFAGRGEGLSYNDAMVRAYLTFVHRPSLGAEPVPERGLGHVHEMIRSEQPLAGLRSVVEMVRAAEGDSSLRPPALAVCLARWLSDAGLEELRERGVADDAVRLVRTLRYANTYYVAREDERADVPRRVVWALEAALNRFLLLEEAFGDRATLATDVDCARWDAYLIETVARQQPPLDELADAPRGATGGEWELRCAMGAAIERLRLPYRIEASLRADVASGVVALGITVPDGSFMPSWVWQEASLEVSAGWKQVSPEEREAQARRYAMHVGLVLAAAAFEASPSIRRVDLAAWPFVEPSESAAGSAGESEFPRDDRPPAYFQVCFDRASYEANARFASAREADPAPFFAACGARLDVPDADPFAFVNSLASAVLRRELPETCEDPIVGEACRALGADDSWNMRIEYDAAHRRLAEGLADRIVRASSASDAIRLVRAAQEEAGAMMDDRAVSSCTRLMAALAEGELDMGDQNAVVSCFLGEDRCLVALGRAKALGQDDPEASAAVLAEAVAEAEALDGFVDGAKTVYRAFDSYAARVLYNRARRDGGAPERAALDASKRVELAPDSFYLCHLEIARILEHSFERTDEALVYGKRAIELAPATAAGYRQLGRAYMLVGDMENAARILEAGLRIAVQPSDIAMAYYQLGYVLWKAGSAGDGALCYLKSLASSPVVAVQATTELHELLEESEAFLPRRENIDEALAHAGLPVAPTEEVLDALGEGAAAAVDAGLFPVARNLLSLRLRFCADDALVNVLRSLEE